MIHLLHRLYVRFRDRHDPAARVTGYSQRFHGHDQQKAVDASKRADQHAKVSRKAAAQRALPRASSKPEKVTDIRTVKRG